MLLFPIIDYSMPKKNNDDRDEEAQAAISDTDKDIKKGMDRYETRTKSAAEEEEEKHSQQATLRGLKNRLLMATSKSPKC
jgi:hypothetical protein